MASPEEENATVLPASGESFDAWRQALPEAKDPALGTLIGPFRIEAKLGQGGMGVVYRASDERLRRSVALKLLPQDFTADLSRRQRFVREARAAAALVHPNIATVFEVGEAGGRVFLAMELIEGDTLRGVMASGTVSYADAQRIAREIARGLAKAHKAGIVHRDLKPDNVMLTSEGDAKILDFGLAKRLDVDTRPKEAQTVLTVEGGVMGTPGYMSPEQARGKTVDARTDVFAFGVMLYEMLSGAQPFTGDSAADLLVAVLSTTPTPLAKQNPAVDPELALLVDRCLAKEVSDRPADGQALVAAFDAIASSARLGASGVTSGAGAVPRSGTEATSTSDADRKVPTSSQGAFAATEMVHSTSNSSVPGAAAGTPAVTGASSGDIARAPSSSKRLAVLGGLVVAVLVAVGAVRGLSSTPSGSAAGTPGSSSVAQLAGDAPSGSTGPLTAASGAPSLAPGPSASAAGSAPAPVSEEIRRVLLVVLPSDASVELDGVPVKTRDGVLEIVGKLGSVHHARVFKGKTEIEGDVSITMSGAIPPKLDLANAKTKGHGPTPVRVKNFDE